MHIFLLYFLRWMGLLSGKDCVQAVFIKIIIKLLHLLRCFATDYFTLIPAIKIE